MRSRGGVAVAREVDGDRSIAAFGQGRANLPVLLGGAHHAVEQHGHPLTFAPLDGS